MIQRFQATPEDPPLSLERDGAERVDGAALGVMPLLRDILAHLPPDRAGVRLTGIMPLRPLLAADGIIGALAASTLGPRCTPVRAILFDKTPETNWPLGWHQDRAICVVERIEVAGFGPWTVKQGLVHVAPPIEVLAGMLTLRVHLDDVPDTNAPLLIAPGSHRFGRVPVGKIDEAIRRCGTRSCLAQAGDVWLYATPILHASDAAMRPARRRVLQVDYAARELPSGLRWLGV